MKILKYFIFIVIFVFSINTGLSQWGLLPCPQELSPYSIGVVGYSENYLYVGSNNTSGTNHIWVTSNNGNNWIYPYEVSASVFAYNGIYEYAGISNGGVYKSTNNGMNWLAINNGLPTTGISALALIVDTLFAGTTQGVYKTIDHGDNWNQTSLTIQVVSMVGKSTMIFAGCYDKTIYKTTNFGANWDLVSSFSQNIRVVALNTNNPVWRMFVGLTADGGVYWADSMNLITTPIWHHNTSFNSNPFSIIVKNDSIGIGTTYGLYLSTNNGSNFSLWDNSGLDTFKVYSIIYCPRNNDYWFFAGTNHGVYSVNYLLTTVSNNETKLKNAELSQNCPNPFNPTTSIKFDIAKKSFVSLTVYDILGTKICDILSNKDMKSGSYEYIWDGSKYASGIYFYKLATSDGYSSTKKMILIK